MELSQETHKKVLEFQRAEITEHHIYKRIAKRIKSEENARIINQIADDELRHYNGWKEYTKEEVQPRWLGVEV
jgi:rubrerythrin